jgi:hypothetical protein
MASRTTPLHLPRGSLLVVIPSKSVIPPSTPNLWRPLHALCFDDLDDLRVSGASQSVRLDFKASKFLQNPKGVAGAPLGHRHRQRQRCPMGGSYLAARERPTSSSPHSKAETRRRSGRMSRYCEARSWRSSPLCISMLSTVVNWHEGFRPQLPTDGLVLREIITVGDLSARDELRGQLDAPFCAQPSVAWRAADSLSLRGFLGIRRTS